MYALVDRCAWGMHLEIMEAGASKHSVHLQDREDLEVRELEVLIQCQN